MINEATIGWAAWTELQTVPSNVLSQLQRQNIGISLSQINPAMNPLNVIPTMTFGGITSAATSSRGRVR